MINEPAKAIQRDSERMAFINAGQGRTALSWRQVLPPLAAGASGGLVLLITLRVWYYELVGLHPNMGPQIAYMFAPVLLMVIFAVAVPVEAIFRRFHQPASYFEALLVGWGHSTLLSWWAFPKHAWIFLILNPLLIRTTIALLCRQG